MSFRYFGFIKTVIVALALAIAPLFATNIVLNQYAKSRAITEMEAMGRVTIHRAEEVITSTVSLLQRLDRDNVQTCNSEDRSIFEKQIIEHGMIDAIGLADASGRRMCVTPDHEISSEKILPPLRADGPLVGIGMLDRSYLGARAAVISWDLKDQTRLFAEVSPAVIALDPGPEYLVSYRMSELHLGDNLLWYSVGGYNSEANDPSKLLTVQVTSELYPLLATMEAPVSAAGLVVQDLKVIAVAACAGIAILFVSIGVWFSWRPEREADDEFAAAIRKGEFIPYYQPVVDLESGRLRGCEILMRWRRANGMLVSPGQFMAYAESSGHIFDMTRHLMRVSAEEVGELYGDNPDLKLSINLFAGHFRDREVIGDIKSIFKKSKVSYQQIVVEVTERHPLEDIELARKIIAEIQALGVRVALDDVGTGHGGMAYLQKLGVDIIKIDKMFVDTIGSDDNSTTIVDSMVELADNLGMGIIAEGVEEKEQIDRLLEMGVTAAQGYFFAQPMPAEEFIEFAAKTEEEARERARLAAEAAAADQAASAA